MIKRSRVRVAGKVCLFSVFRVYLFSRCSVWYFPRVENLLVLHVFRIRLFSMCSESTCSPCVQSLLVLHVFRVYLFSICSESASFPGVQSRLVLQVFQITLRKGYGIPDLKADLAMLYNKTGVKGLGMIFLMTDSQVRQATRTNAIQ